LFLTDNNTAHELVGFETFPACFAALATGEVHQLVLPIANSTTGSILPVLDRLVSDRVSILAEHLVEVRHALLGVPGASPDGVKEVWSHPEALTQASGALARRGYHPVPAHDTAGAVRLVAERGDPSIAALGRPEAAAEHGLDVLVDNMIDRSHNTTRFLVLTTDAPTFGADANKTSISFATSHTPGALALALTELGLRGANLTRIESRPTEDAWAYHFYVDLLHEPGEAGFRAVMDPPPATLQDVHHLGTYRGIMPVLE
jgi:prephenate dehydratase